MGEMGVKPKDPGAALPDEQEQEWLLAQLGELLEQRGAGRFLEEPVVEPTPRFFPELWASDLESARSICQRLLEHAGLGELDVEILAFQGDARGDGEPGHAGVVGWFDGIEGNVCRFGIQLSMLSDAEHTAGILSHEVAHAYRHHHGLRVEDRELEERLTDLTTVYLGLGVLLANVAERTKVTRALEYTAVRRVKMGYLAPEMVAFLLAAHVAAQGLGKEAVRRIGKLLDSNQAVCFRLAHAELDRDREGLLDCLGLPAGTPRAFALRRRTPKWQGAEPWRDGFVWRGLPWGHTTYRMFRARTGAGTVAGLVAGFGWTFVAARFAGPQAFVCWPLSVVAGRLLGRRLRRDRCGGCESALPLHVDECPVCARFIIGEIEHAPARSWQSDHLGKRVFRVVGHEGLVYLTWGGVLAILLIFPFAPRLGWWPILALVAAFTAVAWLTGRLRRLDTCSDFDCQAILDPTLRQCPRCAGAIHGETAR